MIRRLWSAIVEWFGWNLPSDEKMEFDYHAREAFNRKLKEQAARQRNADQLRRRAKMEGGL